MTTQTANSVRKTILFWAGCMAACTMAQGAQFYLRTGVITNTMPDGSQVVMWGFAKDTSAISSDGIVTVPGPALVVPHGDSALSIHLKNQLAVPVSIVIPGQIGSIGPVPSRSLADGRAMSFTHEAAPGGTSDYAWSVLRPGTFLYQSGSHPAVQVQMGLYGSVTKDAALKQAYPGVPYNSAVTLLFSEIDPALHHAVATGSYGPGLAMSSTVAYEPKYFMINGLSYTNGAPSITVGRPGGKILLRLLNAGLKSRVPMVNGAYLKLVAEDGFAYPYAKDQYSVFLAAGKTTDTILRSSTTNQFALYDRTMGLVNGMNSPGGMLAYLKVDGPSINNSALSFDGDALTDLAVYWPATKNWSFKYSIGGTATINWGLANATPVPSDYDGDGRTDLAVYNPATGNWHIKYSTGGSAIINWGFSAAVPVPGDYDGDGISDVAVYWPDKGNWYIDYSGGGTATITDWGWNTATPVPGDYDGDGKVDVAVYAPATGNWHIKYSAGGSAVIKWGFSAAVPVPGDYDGDGKCDLAVYWPATGNWYIKNSSGGSVTVNWGFSAAVPVSSDYDGDGKCDLAVYWSTTGNWYIKYSAGGSATINLGGPDAFPVFPQYWMDRWMHLLP